LPRLTAHRLGRLAALILFCVGVAAAIARADEAPASIEQYNQRLDAARATLDEVNKSLAEPEISETTLRRLRERVDPLPHNLDEVIDKLTPRLAAIDARLKELSGPPAEAKPAEVKPAEAKPAAPPQEEAAEQKPPAPQKAPTPPTKPRELKQSGKPADRKSPPAKPEVQPAETAAAPSEADAAAATAMVDAERAEQRKLYDEADATLKRARALQIEARQTLTTIAARQRALFAKNLFLRTSGLFSPALWREAVAEAPTTAADAQYFLLQRAATFVNRLDNGRKAEFLAVLLAIALAVWPAILLSRRVLARAGGERQPNRLTKAARAAWTATVTAAVPIAVFGAVGVALRGFDLVDSTIEPVLQTVFGAVARVALSYALARAVFAPRHPQWRLLDPGDALAARFVNLAVAVSATVSITRLFEQLEEVVQAALPVVIVTRGVGVAIVAMFMASAFAAIPRRNGEAEAAPPLQRDWFGLARFFGLTAVVAILVASAAGYVTFANFVILEAGWIVAVLAALHIALGFATAGITAAFQPAGAIGRLLSNGFAMRRESLSQMAVALSGVATLACYAIAALVALSPLGVESGDFLAQLRSAFFSFRIGDVTISPSNALASVLLFAVILAATHGLRRWLEQRFLPLTRLDMGLRNSISTSIGYVGFILATGVALSNVGLSFEKLAIVAGALSVGIGFGLQSIVNNFVSGLILLWERAIRVGDWVVVGDEQGYVKRINVRSTEIETFDRATMIVPNSNLVAGVVKNWLRGDKVGRIKIALAPHAGVDPEKIRDVLLSVARAQEGVLRIPAPQVMFLGMEANLFRFELWCYVEDVEQSTRVRSDLHFDLHKRLAQEGVTIAAASSPPPPTILQLPDLEKLAAAAAVGAFALDQAVKDDAAKESKKDGEAVPEEEIFVERKLSA